MHLLNPRSFILMFFISFLLFSCKENYSAEDVFYKNGDISISARIYKPNKGDRFPAVIIVPSADPDTKDVYSAYAEYFASHGIVAICYDKRGAGKSTGNIWKTDFTDLFYDAYSGIQYIKSMPYIDTTQMGFLGHSQGGMYIFMADSITHDIAFVIDVAGSPTSPLKQSHYNIESKIMEYGGTKQYADSLAFLMDDYILYLSGRNNYESLQRRYDIAKSDIQKPIADKINYFEHFQYLVPPEKLPPYGDMEMYPFMRSCNYESRRFFSSLSIPALIIYGKKDRVINTPYCIEVAKEGMQQNKLIELKIYEEANHAMKEETFSGQKYPNDYFKEITAWIKMH